MLKFDTHNRKIHPLESTELKTEDLLERNDLQQTICNSWDLFKFEIGLPSAYLIGQEIQPGGPTQNRIDILAFDADDSSLVVIELKRDRNKLQLLQSLSYAAMVGKWDAEILIPKIQRECTPDIDELTDLINANDLNNDIKIILIAENYDPEVIITSDWLVSNYALNITAFAISLYKMANDTFLALDQKYPLKELSDSYDLRRSPKKNKKKQEITWDEITHKLNYPFAEEAIAKCLAIKPGDPSRQRFLHIKTGLDGFRWVTLMFRKNYINTYIIGSYENDEEFLRTKFGKDAEISSWKHGWSVLIRTQEQYIKLFDWLDI